MARVIADGQAPAWAHQLADQINRALASRALPSYSVATLPSAKPAGQQIFVIDESGGAVPAFSDGQAWRRTSDRAIVS